MIFKTLEAPLVHIDDEQNTLEHRPDPPHSIIIRVPFGIGDGDDLSGFVDPLDYIDDAEVGLRLVEGCQDDDRGEPSFLDLHDGSLSVTDPRETPSLFE